MKKIEEGLAPNLKINVYPDDFPTLSLTKYKYPLQEYTLMIANENNNSAPIENLTVEIHFPYIISSIKGKTGLFGSGPVNIWNMRQVETKSSGEVIITEEETPETPASKSMSLSIEKWKVNDALINSHIAIFSCQKFPNDSVFTGTIIVDVTKKPTGLIKVPDNIGKYFGKYNYNLHSKMFPHVNISGDIDKLKLDLKLAEYHFDQGKLHAEKDDCENAILELSEAIRLNQKHPNAYLLRGICYGIMKNPLKAKNDFDEAIKINQSYGLAYYNRAIAKEELKENPNDIKQDYEKAFNLGLDIAARPYLSLMLTEVNPQQGFLEYTIRNNKWLEKNNELIDIIPHISKDNFEIHAFRDKDNILKVLISNGFSTNVILQFNRIEYLRKSTSQQNHNLRVSWFNGENKLYVDDMLVDVYPIYEMNPNINTQDDVEKSAIIESNLFKGIAKANAEQGHLTVSISNPMFIERSGLVETVLPHILTEQIELYAYKDIDGIFKVFFSNPFVEKAYLHFNELDKLKDNPNHPKHEISIGWLRGEISLYIDEHLVDRHQPTDDKFKSLDKH